MPNKYRYSKVLQVNYGQGWEDTCEYHTDSQGVLKDAKECADDLKAYRENCDYPVRIIRRRELREDL